MLLAQLLLLLEESRGRRHYHALLLLLLLGLLQFPAAVGAAVGWFALPALKGSAVGPVSGGEVSAIHSSMRCTCRPACCLTRRCS
jgi:hypothetical protein